MQEREASTQFTSDGIHKAVLEHDPVREGWTIHFFLTDGTRVPLENKRGRCIRLFKTSDAALRWCQRIGFREVFINL